MGTGSLILAVIVWGINLVISWFNARSCGLVWVETKKIGGWQRFMTWMGAIMSASGFTWCYLIVLLLIGHVIHDKQGAPYLSTEAVHAGLSLGYIIIIPGVLFTGLMIWIDSLVKAWRERSFSSIGVAGWNTFAQIHNTYSAMRGIPEAWKSVSSFFSGKGSGKSKGAMLIIIAVVAAIISGVLTTWAIINKYAGSRSLPTQN